VIDLRLPVRDASGQRRIEEAVPAEQLAAGRYRLAGSPGLVQGLAAGDEVELVPDEPAGFRVLRRGGQLCFWVYLPEPAPAGTDARLSRAAASLGGYMDGGNTRLRILTIPAAAGFRQIEAVLDRTVGEVPDTSWAWGNPHDLSGDPT
jgi:hypothetical protein